MMNWRNDKCPSGETRFIEMSTKDLLKWRDQICCNGKTRFVEMSVNIQ